MIMSFRDKDTRRVFNDEFVSRFQEIRDSARRKLLWLDAVTSLDQVGRLPGSRPEALKGDRKGQYIIRINARWRICFRWHRGHAFQVEIVDLH